MSALAENWGADLVHRGGHISGNVQNLYLHYLGKPVARRA